MSKAEEKDLMVTPETIALFKAKTLNSGGVFKCIAATIELGFATVTKPFIYYTFNKDTRQRIKHNRREEFITFLKSPVVQAWCDCSDNFSQDRLLGYYLRLISQ